MMRPLTVLTVHPEFILAYAKFGVFKAARERKLAEVTALNLRDFAVDKHGSVDDRPFGGGDGMVMRPEPLTAALAAVSGEPRVIYTSPAGKPWTHAEAERLAAGKEPLVFVCGRFAGVDQRFLDKKVHEQYSLGDFVLSGGELAALAMIDSILRFVPGVLGHQESALKDSFADGCAGGLEHPLYTRPPEWEGMKVPEVLMGGDHEKIAAWRREEAKRRTAELRPDLMKR